MTQLLKQTISGSPELRPTVFADYAFVGITVHPAVVGTHPSALLVHRLQEFCAVGVGFALAPSLVFGISAIQMLCVKTGNSIIVVYLVPTFFDFFPSRYVGEEPADGAALGALSALMAFIATESEKHQFIVSASVFRKVRLAVVRLADRLDASSERRMV